MPRVVLVVLPLGATEPNMPVERRREDTPGWRAAARFSLWTQSQLLSQTEIAERLGCSQSVVSAMITGKRPVSGRLLDRVAELVGMPVDVLVSAEGAPVWDEDDWPVIAEVYQLPDDVRRAFVDQWRAALEMFKKANRSFETKKENFEARGGRLPKKEDAKVFKKGR